MYYDILICTVTCRKMEESSILIFQVENGAVVNALSALYPRDREEKTTG